MKKNKKPIIKVSRIEQSHLLIDRLKYRNAVIMPNNANDHLLIDIILRELYDGGDKRVLDIKKDILIKYKLPSDDKTINRLWDLLDAGHLINPVVGFGNAYKASLTVEGYNLMLKHGSYMDYLKSLEQPVTTITTTVNNNVNQQSK